MGIRAGNSVLQYVPRRLEEYLNGGPHTLTYSSLPPQTGEPGSKRRKRNMTTFSINLLVALATLSATQAVTTVVLPTKPPAWIKPLSKDLIGLSIEMDRWTSWAGPQVGQPNTFLNQVLDNLSNLTGKPVPLRIGGE